MRWITITLAREGPIPTPGGASAPLLPGLQEPPCAPREDPRRHVEAMPVTAATVDERARARVGRTIAEKYRLERVLGVGGMAAVYQAVHRNGHRVALKMLHPELALDPDVRGRFLREGYVANKVEHRGAVSVLDDHADAEGVFLVMDLLEGESLDTRLERAGGWLPVADVCLVAAQVLEVLEAAHAKSIVHRDIKPENLFVSNDGSVRVLDFGIARLREPDGTHHTRTGGALGTPAYMAPEQARGRRADIDARTDLWALGATMFTLLSGQYVHQEAETSEEAMILTATRHVRPLAAAAAHVAAPLAAVVDRALAYAMAERWPSAKAMREALEAAYLAVHGEALGGAKLGAPSALGATGEMSAAPAEATLADGGPQRSDDPVTLSDAASFSPKAATGAGLTRPSSLTASSRSVSIFATGIVSFLVLLSLGIAVAARVERSAAHASHGGDASFLAAPAPPAAPSATPVPSAAAPATGTAAVPPPPSVPPHARGTFGRPPPPSARSEAAPSLPAATPPGQCTLESYVEMVKGEPVTRYRRVCP